jgi:F0F1-type ATP synthase membrane subunit b/b'
METAQLETLREVIKKGEQYKIEDLVSRNEWGSINFESARTNIEQVMGTFSHLANLPVENLTQAAAVQIESALSSVVGQLEAVSTFSIDSGDAAGTRDALVVSLNTQVENLLTVTAPWIPYLAYQKGDIQKNINSLNSAVDEAVGLIDEAKTTISNKNEEVDGIVTQAREAAGKAGAAVFTKEFTEESKRNIKLAKPWLITAGIFGGLTIAVAGLMWFYTETPEAGTEFQLLGSKFVVLGVLFTVTLWCGRMYKTLMNQGIINKQKAMGLQTFQAFSSAADDPAVKDAVLMETTKSIFSIQGTGLVEGDRSSTEGITRIIETVKSVAGDSK